MPLLTPPPQPPAPTQAQLDQVKKNLTFQAVSLLTKYPYQMFLAWKTGVESIWKNPNGLTPSEVVTALGPNATELFSMSADFAALLEKHSPGITTPVMVLIGTFTPHSDGSITVP